MSQRTAEEIAEAVQRRSVRFPLVTGIVEVVAVDRVSPKMARIGFAGSVLDEMPHDEPGEIATFIWPDEGREVVLPISGSWRFPPGAEGQHWRNYTVRRLRRGVPGHGTVLEADFVLHGDHGRATRWAGQAAVGQRLGIAGPRLHWVSDPEAEWSLLVGDETALPAIAATLEQLPRGHRALAFVEVDGPEEQQAIDAVCDADVVWLSRDGAPAGTGTRLVDAVRAAELPSGRGKVWAAGESMAIRDVREHLRDERGVDPETMQAIGYWRHRETPEDVI
ncbi:MAG: siderophore-interacting protein [Patulibacter sp.]|nr:siderophore-interacting protein [Patulibacter sp.]